MNSKSSYPRNGRYELFTYNNIIHCFDDLSFKPIKASDEIYLWIKNQDKNLWEEPLNCRRNVAIYLQPKLYTMFKLKWGVFK